MHINNQRFGPKFTSHNSKASSLFLLQLCKVYTFVKKIYQSVRGQNL